MYSFQEINDFVMRNTGSQYFDADVKLYKKHFPNSKLNAELDRAPEFAKKALDERIVYELLNNQDSCIDCIWENRGFVRDENGKVIPLKADQSEDQENESEDYKMAADEAQKAVLETLKHNDLKKLVFGLKLQGKCVDQKKETYLKVLKEFVDLRKQGASVESHSYQVIGQMNQEKAEETPAPERPDIPASEPFDTVGEPKKKEDQSSNTQE